jgi:hypothetical protein
MAATGGLRKTLDAMLADKNIYRSPDAIGPAYEHPDHTPIVITDPSAAVGDTRWRRLVLPRRFSCSAKNVHKGALVYDQPLGSECLGRSCVDLQGAGRVSSARSAIGRA